jgi:multiple sugar transport system permease protein
MAPLSSRRGLAYLPMLALALVFLFPFFWTVASSLKASSELFNFPPTWLPEVPQWGNYATVLTRVPFVTWFVNSLIVVTLGTVGSLISCTLVAYSFSRFRYHGRELLFVLTLGTVMLPAEVTLVPRYLIFRELGWLDSLRPLWVPEWLAGSAFTIFLIRQFMLSIPRDLDEAAIVDGASYPRILVSILVPLLKPVLATAAVIGAIAHWNDFLGPLIYLNSPENYTLAVGLRYFNQSPGESGRPQQHLLMAAAVMSITPCIVLFFAAQRYFVRGIVTSGIKG